MEHDFDNADGASPFRLGTGAEPGDSGVNADEKKRLTEFSSRYNGGKGPKSDIPERAKEPSRRDVSASFSNGQDHAERVDGPAISDGRQREKRRRRSRRGGEERSGRMLQHVGGCMKSDVEKREQESDAFARGRGEKEGERARAQHVSGI